VFVEGEEVTGSQVEDWLSEASGGRAVEALWVLGYLWVAGRCGRLVESESGLLYGIVRSSARSFDPVHGWYWLTYLARRLRGFVGKWRESPHGSRPVSRDSGGDRLRHASGEWATDAPEAHEWAGMAAEWQAALRG